MIDVQEFISLCKIPLELRVINDWLHAADDKFVDYIVSHHRELDYQHLRCAMQLLQDANRDDVREFYSQYVDHENMGYSTLARGSLDLQRERGWIAQPAK